MSDSMEVLGWTLVHFCWQATLIALLYRVADIVFVRSRSHVRYGLALAALLSMLAVALVTMGYEGIQATRNSEVRHGAVATAESEVLDHASSRRAVGTVSAPPITTRIDIAEYLVTAMPWLDGIWLAGVVILSVRTAGGWYVIRTLRRSGLVEVPAEVKAIFSQLARRIKISRPADLYISECISGPLAMGVLRSVVLLPVSAVTHLSPGQLQVVLAHELAHIRRHDYLWNIVQTMAETLFFFHPAVWWVSANLREQRELCCDDEALAGCSDPVVYATALLCLEEQRSSKMRLAMALDGHQRGLKARIFRILGEAPQNRRQIAPLSLVGICAMVGLFLLPLPRLFADRAVRASELIPAAAMIAQQQTLISREQASRISSASIGSPVVAPPEIAQPDRPVQPAPVAKPTSTPQPIRAPQLPVSPVVRGDVAEEGSAAPMVVTTQISKVFVAPRAIAMFASQASDSGSAKSDYIAAMRAAGYGDDLDKLIEMKIQDITPEYARSMAQLGFGKPTAQELISLKIFGVTPETVQTLKASGMAPSKLQDLVSYQIFKVTPEFVAGMKTAGFSDIPPAKLVELRIHGVTPESAKATKQQFPEVTIEQLVQLRIFHIDEAFIASAKQHGFNNLSIDKLVRLRISGLLDDGDQKSEKKK